VVANKLLIGIGGTLAAAALTIGAVSASGGGPISSDGDDVNTEDAQEQEASPPPVEEEEDGEAEDEDDAEEEDSDELDDEEGDTDEDSDDDEDDEAEDENEDAQDSTGTQKIAEAIAEEFDTTSELVLALHDEGIGFGAIFKLYLIARAKGMTVDELLAEIEEDGGGFAFGKLKKSLSEEEMEIFEEGPKNLGALVSGANRDGSDDSDAEDRADEGETSRGGAPGHAKAKGHGKNN